MKKLVMHGAKRLFMLVAVILVLGGCTTAAPAASPGERASLSLPTQAPTVAPSPVSTRVMPLADLTPAPTPTVTPIPDETLGLVVEVLDGETIAVVLDGDPARQAYQVKYLGLDAPPNSPDDPWGVVAFETNRKLANLKIVKLVRDQTDFDADGFMLRYVYIGNQLLNAELVRQGLARAAVSAPDTRFEAEISKAEAEAQADELGLWNPNPPTPTPLSQPTATPTAVDETTPRAAITTTVTVTASQTPSATRQPTAASTITPAANITPTVTITATSAGLQGPP